MADRREAAWLAFPYKQGDFIIMPIAAEMGIITGGEGVAAAKAKN